MKLICNFSSFQNIQLIIILRLNYRWLDIMLTGNMYLSSEKFFYFEEVYSNYNLFRMGCNQSSAASPNTNNQAGQAQQKPAQQAPATNNSTTKPSNPTTVVPKQQVKQEPKKGNSIHDIELARHNEYRAKHKAPALVMSDWLNKGAQKWADYLAKNDKFQHSQCNIDGKGVGENIYWTSAKPSGGDATKSWYDEVKDYKYGSGESTFNKTGHFSQVVWKASKEVGFGFSGGVVVANYYPAGNLMGSWEKNVEKP